MTLYLTESVVSSPLTNTVDPHNPSQFCVLLLNSSTETVCCRFAAKRKKIEERERERERVCVCVCVCVCLSHSVLCVYFQGQGSSFVRPTLSICITRGTIGWGVCVRRLLSLFSCYAVSVLQKKGRRFSRVFNMSENVPIVLGQYRLGKTLGIGAFGKVKCKHHLMNTNSRFVSLSRLFPGILLTGSFVCDVLK
jgi:hypothetical protein